jgi:hypothetical protein
MVSLDNRNDGTTPLLFRRGSKVKWIVEKSDEDLFQFFDAGKERKP